METIDKVAPDATESIPNTATGVVTNCVALNVRTAPTMDSDVLRMIVYGHEVNVDLDESTEDFYKIEDGYCLKQFVQINGE